MECPPVPPVNAMKAIRDAYDCWMNTKKIRYYLLVVMNDVTNPTREA